MSGLERVLPDPTPPPGARARVRAGIAPRVERSRRRRMFAGYAVVVACAAFAVATMSILRSGARVPESLLVGAPLGAGVIELPSHARVLISPDSAVSLVRDDASGTLLRLDRGALVAHVTKRAAGHPFVVIVRDVRVEVVGTIFAVGVAADGTVGVRGYEGTVRVVAARGETRVGAGDSWPSAAAAPIADADALLQVAFVERAPVVVPAPAPVPAIVPTPAPLRVPRVAAAAESQRPYRAAKHLEETGDLKQALAAYQAIADGGAPEAEDGLYAVGRLDQGVLHDADAALVAFTAYRKRYPLGRYIRAVDVHLLELAIARGDYEAIEREANWFLAEHSDDAMAPRVRIARAAARVQRGDCKAARADLDLLPRSAVADRLRASCGF